VSSRASVRDEPPGTCQPLGRTAGARCPWLQAPGQVAAGLGTDLTAGLTSAEVAARIERDGPNRLDVAAVIPTWRKLLAQFDDPLIHLLFGAIVVSLGAWFLEGRQGTPFEVIVITVIVVVNAVLG
jgi:P-type Ca2+ transporter type 2C